MFVIKSLHLISVHFWTYLRHFDFPLVGEDIPDANTITFAKTFVCRCQMYTKAEN